VTLFGFIMATCFFSETNYLFLQTHFFWWQFYSNSIEFE
jgi:hypothetical protein